VADAAIPHPEDIATGGKAIADSIRKPGLTLAERLALAAAGAGLLVSGALDAIDILSPGLDPIDAVQAGVRTGIKETVETITQKGINDLPLPGSSSSSYNKLPTPESITDPSRILPG
jgi:hypothetical protein